MRKFFILLLLVIARQAIGQQNFSMTPYIPEFKKLDSAATKKLQDSNKINGDNSIDNKELREVYPGKFVGIYGIGNLNSESLNNLNAGGKVTAFIKPSQGQNTDLTFYLSFNKNASNKDSLLASTLIFPEVGNNAFLGTVDFLWKKNGLTRAVGNGQISKQHAWGPFFEMSHKNIKVDTVNNNKENETLYFSTLHYTLGFRYLFSFSNKYQKNNAEEHDYGGLSLSLFVSHMNIPDEDSIDYKKILKNNYKDYSESVKDNFWSVGVKIVFQIKEFQVFADLRHVLGNKKDLPIRDLRGFNSNIGIVFNTEIFSF
jgi:hypothetical protein